MQDNSKYTENASTREKQENREKLHILATHNDVFLVHTSAIVVYKQVPLFTVSSQVSS